MVVTAYPVVGKQKSLDICKAFADGCSGIIAAPGHINDDTPSMFFGVDSSNEKAWRRARDSGADYYYADNSYFDSQRQKKFRITKNAFQHSGVGESDGKRFAELGEQVAPWQQDGTHIVICEQSTFFMQTIAGLSYPWMEVIVGRLQQLTTRPLQKRAWSSDKMKLGRTLGAALAGAHALVTWSSAAAVTALLAGVPIVSCGPSAAKILGGELKDIECLPRPGWRSLWAGVLADNEWTLEEIHSGMAWEKLNA